MNLNRRKILIGFGMALGAATSAGVAQQTTERFIPIGESPGKSNRTSYIGRIVAVDAGGRTVTVQDDGGTGHTLQVTNSTRIWLDRSALGLSNEVGSYADCQVGRRAEVSYTLVAEGVADWIKVAAN
ncbi:MAG: hypothetical protein OER43_18725 [Gammaproteobacteria bacterium]|nr:hypothetical protein [Gammaproteobacteria bacterium]